MTVHWTDAAVLDLVGIWADLARATDPDGAQRVVDRIRAFCGRVALFPGLVPQPHDPENGARMIVANTRYAVWVTVERGDLVVLRVRHQRQRF